LYSNLRFVISASLVGCAGLIAVLALLPATFEERLLASDEVSAQPALACNQQNWWHFDRSCLSRRGMPWVTDAPDANTVPSATESAPEQVASKTEFSDITVEGRAIGAVAPRQEAPVPPVVATSRHRSRRCRSRRYPRRLLRLSRRHPSARKGTSLKRTRRPPATRLQPRRSCTRSGASRSPRPSRRHPRPLRRKQRARIVVRNRPTRR
jgi:hypothetical protein